MNLNKIFVGGRLTADPELRQTPGGTSAVRISVAVSRGKPRDGGEEITDFIDVTAFDKRAELLARKFRKGSRILIVGRLQQRRWETKSGEKRQSPVTVPSTGKQVGIPIPPSHLPPSYGGAQAGYEEIPGDDQLPF